MAMFTTKSTGTVFGLVKDHGNCKLAEALSRITEMHLRDHRFSVHVFRNVIEPRRLPQWTKETIDPCVDDALELSLETIVTAKLYRKCRVAIGEESVSGTILHSLNATNGDVASTAGKNRPSIVSAYMERFFMRATQEDWACLYFYNCKRPPPEYASILSGISGHLDPATNSRVEDMDGINTPMFYVGAAESFTELHVEDSLADSANVIHAGNDKIWIIVDREDHGRLNEIVNVQLKEVTGDSVDEEACPFPLHHKDIVVTPSLLDEHKIRYEFVEQHAGDLVYVRFGVLHQVVNVGVNVAEAINVGSPEWNLANELKALCRCESSSLSHIATNVNVDMCVRVGKTKVRAHPCDKCGRIFNGKGLLEKHKKDHHDDVHHHCEICNANFKHSQSLKRHKALTHSIGVGTNRGSNLCPLCHKTVKDITRHRLERHSKQVPCSGCGTSYTRHDLVAHVRNCVTFSCAVCNKTFKSRQSLGNHKRTCNKSHGK